MTRPIRPPSAGRIVAISEVRGLHHRYDRVAAQQPEKQRKWPDIDRFAKVSRGESQVKDSLQAFQLSQFRGISLESHRPLTVW